MMSNDHPSTWRDVIAQQIANPQERQRLADALGIRPITLTRWAQGSHTPTLSTLALYLKLAPSSVELFPLLIEEFPILETFSHKLEEESTAIPVTMYQQVLKALTTTSEAASLQAIGALILQHAVEQLDPGRTGVTLLTLICQSPTAKGSVQSLRAVLNSATSSLEEVRSRTAFVGAESLSGYSVTCNRPIVLQDSAKKQEYPYPVQRTELARSLCMYPLQRHHRVAGCLWVGSRQPHHFTVKRVRLIEQYAHLMQLLFPSSYFYDLQQIQLQVFPPILQQQPVLKTAPQRIQGLLQRKAQQQEILSYAQAEQCVWSDLEEELIVLAASHES